MALYENGPPFATQWTNHIVCFGPASCFVYIDTWRGEKNTTADKACDFFEPLLSWLGAAAG